MRCCHYSGATKEEGRGGEGGEKWRESGEDLSVFLFLFTNAAVTTSQRGRRETEKRETEKVGRIFQF